MIWELCKRYTAACVYLLPEANRLRDKYIHPVMTNKSLPEFAEQSQLFRLLFFFFLIVCKLKEKEHTCKKYVRSLWALVQSYFLVFHSSVSNRNRRTHACTRMHNRHTPTKHPPLTSCSTLPSSASPPPWNSSWPTHWDCANEGGVLFFPHRLETIVAERCLSLRPLCVSSTESWSPSSPRMGTADVSLRMDSMEVKDEWQDEDFPR